MLTQDLSDAAIALRRAITDAREPDTLLFEQLPQALNFDAFGPSVKTDSKTVDVFFNALQDTLSELKQAYDDLLSSIEGTSLFLSFPYNWIEIRPALN